MAKEPTAPYGGSDSGKGVPRASSGPARLNAAQTAAAAAAAGDMASADPALRAAQDLFVRRWGDMGHAWGINRTMAEIYALLYITARPLGTDKIIDRLSISRGNASTNLRALCDWGIVRRQHRRGERREYFESLGDVWEVFAVIAAERKRRELDPVLDAIRQCERMLDEPSVAGAGPQDEVQATRRRLEGMREFMDVTNRICARFVNNSSSGLTQVARVLLRAL
jgi:HTH-type transcriptional regulator, glycine betaine synthesis regulator